ncbi:MAG: nitroreductase family protein [Candidatus Pacearchaeota archaeon]
MEFNKVITLRKSIRKFKSKKPDWRQIIEAIDYASKIPYAGNIHNIKFIIIDKKRIINEISKYCEQDFVSKVDYLVVITSDPTDLVRSYNEIGEKFSTQQGGAATQQFLLKLVDTGLDGCWVGAFDEASIKRILEIPEEIRVESIIPLGYALPSEKSTKPKSKPDINKVLRFNTYKNKFMNGIKEVEAF